MDESKYKYDIAFSLLAKDEPLAQEINDLLSDRYKTFLYSERQKEIAGADGELKFKSVFAEEARMVVVLYRNGWGQTPWTRMEEEAIRGRAYDEGYEFVKFVPLDETPTVPMYLPKVQLWINALRFGAKGAAAIIEARLGELGAPTRAESAIDRAARLQRKLDFQSRHESYGRTERAVDDANNSFAELMETLKIKLTEMESSGVKLHLQLKQDRDRSIIIIGLKYGLKIQWRYNYRNSLEGSSLNIEIWDGHPPMMGAMSWDEPRKRKTLRFNFELLPTGVGGWTKDGDAFDSSALADFVLHFYMDNGA